MRDGNVRLLKRKEEAIEEVREWFTSLTSPVRALSQSELSSYRWRNVRLGLQCTVQFSDGLVRRIDVLCTDAFPWEPPRIALVDRPVFLTWPHIEEDGVLCLFPQFTEFNSFEAVAVAQYTMCEAFNLIEELITEGGTEDFRREFLTYWARSAGERPRKTLILSRFPEKTGIIKVHRRHNFDLLAETDLQIKDWLERRRLEFDAREFATDAVMLWLNKPPIPAEYPSTGHDVLTLIERTVSATQAQSLLSSLKTVDSEGLTVAIGMPTVDGPCFGAITVLPQPAPYHQAIKRTPPSPADILNRGFRPGRTPCSIAVLRVLSGRRIVKSPVERADPNWIYGRDQDDRFEPLRKAKVTVIGCGSLGGNVAVLLTQAGIGELSLIDPDDLVWANISRHPLGADFVGKSKATSLAECLRKNHPHTKVNAHSSTWQNALRDNPQLMAEDTVSVCVVGDWGVESMVNELHVSAGRKSPLVYAWAEPHACAGHAVIVHQDGGCLQCGFSLVGDANLKVTAWTQSTVRKEPACGAIFQPYGPVELNNIVSMVAEAVLDCVLHVTSSPAHRIWAGRKSLLDSAHGEWTNDWTQLAVDRCSTGGFRLERDWPQKTACPVCGTVENA